MVKVKLARAPTYQQVIAALDAAKGAGVRVIALAPRQLARTR